MIEIKRGKGGFIIAREGKDILIHKRDFPLIEIANGEADIFMRLGNFRITDNISKRRKPRKFNIDNNRIIFTFDTGEIVITINEKENGVSIGFSLSGENINRFFINLPSERSECLYGLGEQFSHFNLKGRKYPVFTQEQGVGRNKKTKITQLADAEMDGGGDYYTTFYAQPTFSSSQKYFVHAETYDYCEFDFTEPNKTSIMFWSLPEYIFIGQSETMLELVSSISDLLGRQEELPDWIYDGITLGLQDGTERCKTILAKAKAADLPVNGIWIQDWQGQKHTSFGKRLRWNWVWDKELYPDLDKWIRELNDENIRLLGYINPYVLKDYSLYNEALKKSYLVLNQEGETYLVDFGQFECGIIDFTNPAAFEWYKEVIKRNLIDLGLSGWMADFGEYLPTDTVLFDKSDPMIAHNRWPGLWAKCNYEAIKESGRDDILYFMRAGNTMSLKYAKLIWAGDQNVAWSEDDGIKTVLKAAFSLAMSGYGLHSSDIGGYTTLYHMKRSKELLLRWAEMEVFTPYMRTHEGNRPLSNWQAYSDNDTLERLAKLTKIHISLKPYIKNAVNENARLGYPVIRPLMLHYDESWCYREETEFLLGRDLLVCPVLKKGVTTRNVRLPMDEWINLFTKERFKKGEYTISCPLGSIPVFYRKGSEFENLFQSFNS